MAAGAMAARRASGDCPRKGRAGAVGGGRENGREAFLRTSGRHNACGAHDRLASAASDPVGARTARGALPAASRRRGGGVGRWLGVSGGGWRMQQGTLSRGEHPVEGKRSAAHCPQRVRGAARGLWRKSNTLCSWASSTIPVWQAVVATACTTKRSPPTSPLPSRAGGNVDPSGPTTQTRPFSGVQAHPTAAPTIHPPTQRSTA